MLKTHQCKYIFKHCICWLGLSSRLYNHSCLLVNLVVGVPQQSVGKARLEQVHREEWRFLNDQIEQDVDRLPVFEVLLDVIIGKPQEAGRGQSEKLLESVLDVLVTAEREENAEQLIHGHGQAVDVVGVTFQLGLNLNLELVIFEQTDVPNSQICLKYCHAFWGDCH